MANDPIIVAMANPVPEIMPDEARAAGARLIATGRSDFPNQVNNVLGFPYIFRGALDVRATAINEEMKIAAVYALAELAKQSVPEQVNITYGEKHIAFGRDYIIPKPFDHRLIEVVPLAVAKAAVESGVAREPIKDWEKYREQLADRLGGGSKWMKRLITQAKEQPKRVVFAEADQLNVLKAAQIVYEEGICKPILLGRQDTILGLMDEINFEATEGDIWVLDPNSDDQKQRREKFADEFWNKRQRKGVKLYDARKLMHECNYFGAMMVVAGEADALISGYTRSYASVIKPMMEVIGCKKDVKRISATNLMLTSKGPLFLSDTAVNINPSAEELASITKMTADTMAMFGIKPAIAMLSYSNFGTSGHELSGKVAKAVSIMHETYPEIDVDGEIQADFALNQEMMKEHFPFSKLAGKKVNALIFPELSSANITYKILKELNDIESVGPILMGMEKAVHLVQLGARVDEMVNMTTIAVVDAQEREKKNKG